ncbi:hypothetical protein JZ751_024240 [Albula glossodonta]|uniref:Uncharacterized protein n=1 Tax=Albula glossodonta TaxID=121402 RepID=A0A8T2NF98_9TELE|nr:hypothetical protein JZ751_024240 [Albula glossodonta]
MTDRAWTTFEFCWLRHSGIKTGKDVALRERRVKGHQLLSHQSLQLIQFSSERCSGGYAWISIERRHLSEEGET